MNAKTQEIITSVINTKKTLQLQFNMQEKQSTSLTDYQSMANILNSLVKANQEKKQKLHTIQQFSNTFQLPNQTVLNGEGLFLRSSFYVKWGYQKSQTSRIHGQSRSQDTISRANYIQQNEGEIQEKQFRELMKKKAHELEIWDIYKQINKIGKKTEDLRLQIDRLSKTEQRIEEKTIKIKSEEQIIEFELFKSKRIVQDQLQLRGNETILIKDQRDQQSNEVLKVIKKYQDLEEYNVELIQEYSNSKKQISSLQIGNNQREISKSLNFIQMIEVIIHLYKILSENNFKELENTESFDYIFELKNNKETYISQICKMTEIAHPNDLVSFLINKFNSMETFNQNLQNSYQQNNNDKKYLTRILNGLNTSIYQLQQKENALEYYNEKNDDINDQKTVNLLKTTSIRQENLEIISYQANSFLWKIQTFFQQNLQKWSRMLISINEFLKNQELQSNDELQQFASQMLALKTQKQINSDFKFLQVDKLQRRKSIEEISSCQLEIPSQQIQVKTSFYQIQLKNKLQYLFPEYNEAQLMHCVQNLIAKLDEDQIVFVFCTNKSFNQILEFHFENSPWPFTEQPFEEFYVIFLELIIDLKRGSYYNYLKFILNEITQLEALYFKIQDQVNWLQKNMKKQHSQPKENIFQTYMRKKSMLVDQEIVSNRYGRNSMNSSTKYEQKRTNSIAKINNLPLPKFHDNKKSQQSLRCEKFAEYFGENERRESHAQYVVKGSLCKNTENSFVEQTWTKARYDLDPEVIQARKMKRSVQKSEQSKYPQLERHQEEFNNQMKEIVMLSKTFNSKIKLNQNTKIPELVRKIKESCVSQFMLRRNQSQEHLRQKLENKF